MKRRNPIARAVKLIRSHKIPNNKRQIKYKIECKEYLKQLKNKELEYTFYE